jgi:DNA polymerase III subunit epsilon
MEFLVIDFETACFDNSSICQVGLVKYNNGEIITLLDNLINPNTIFTNTRIHGISQQDVVDSPTFSEIYSQIEEYIKGKVVFNHNGSDKSKFEAACEKAGLPIFHVTWLNSATLVRRTWSQFSSSGYGVEEMCGFLDINYKPHNAAFDAYATALIIEKASAIKKYSIEDWIKNLSKTSGSRNRTYPQYDDKQIIKGEIKHAPDLNSIRNKENPFFGKKVVISGTYITWPDRNDLAKILKELGADIDSGIGKYTNYLCAGEGVGPSKYEKMEQKIARGEDAQILTESTIIEMLK